MIQLIARKPLPPSGTAKEQRLADPDILLSIAERLQANGATDREATDQFSWLLHDLRIAGTWKRTNRGRLAMTEAVLCANIWPEPPGVISVLDLGASDGITTLELLAALRLRFGDRVRACTTDLNFRLIRYRKGPLYEYRAGDGEPVLARIGRLGLRLSGDRGGKDAVSDRVAALYLRCKELRRALRRDRCISLVHPLVRGEPAIEAMELDCLARHDALTERFSAVRASNILNFAYFSPAQLRIAIRNVHLYLQDGGCFVASRNEDVAGGEVENGSIWRKAGMHFVHLADFGAGAEIKSIVNASGA